MALTSDILRSIVDAARTAIVGTYPNAFLTVTDSPYSPAAVPTTPAIQFVPIGTEQNADRNGWGCMRFLFRVVAWTQKPADPADQSYYELSSSTSPQAVVETVARILNNTVPTGGAGPIAKRTGPGDITVDRKSGMARSEAEFWLWLEETWTN